MKEATKTKVHPPKGEKAKKQASKIEPPKVPGFKKLGLSSEFIDDSSDSSDNDEDSGAEESTSASKKTPPKPTRIEPPRPTPKLNGQPEKSAKQKKPVNGVLNGSQALPAPRPQHSPAQSGDSDTGSSIRTAEDQSGSASETASESDSSDSGVDESDTTAARLGTEAAAREPLNTRDHTVELRPPPPFKPPPNFTAVLSRPAASSNVMKLFGPSSIPEKQIWHVTVPTGMPIETIKEAALSKIKTGDAIVNHKGTDYGLKSCRRGEETVTQVLLPGPEGYTALSTPVTRSFNLQQVVQLPKLTSAQADQSRGSDAAASSKTSSIKAPRAQPKGLRMRFLPSGFGDPEAGIIGSSDSEAEAIIPNSTNGLHQQEKRKHEETNGDHKLSKKAKKSRDPEHEKRRAEKKARRKAREEAGVTA